MNVALLRPHVGLSRKTSRDQRCQDTTGCTETLKPQNSPVSRWFYQHANTATVKAWPDSRSLWRAASVRAARAHARLHGIFIHPSLYQSVSPGGLLPRGEATGGISDPFTQSAAAAASLNPAPRKLICGHPVSPVQWQFSRGHTTCTHAKCRSES